MVPPVKMIGGGGEFWHAEAVPVTVAVGNGVTVMVTLPDCSWEHVFALASCTPTRL